MAKQVILEGLYDYFGHVDHGLNEDLLFPLDYYQGNDRTLFTGIYRGLIVCTGGLVEEETRIGRIVRISVLDKFRNKGFGREMVTFLEKRAKLLDYQKIVLETNKAWSGTKVFYQRMNYKQAGNKPEITEFFKDI
ncbi:GNAT family N-acetyltransferase [Sediminibacillus halophilus]|uniref:Acetyltransferase (GNAT) domain-containing protein n=1 Tax=Sediminibacillus halophilus TaxID=482461 RepID=A0A1G9S4X2_9BACI|nr:GNAT family N-acetyltransferase [Sediminibacillus halophilus]SDM30441.1 Acetyltransferase (GNAT) domain-containing protein [Sediminibacillus halophilus]